MATVADLIGKLETIAPPELASEGDRIGLQVGNRASEVRRVCVAVDPSGPVVDRALQSGAELLITHHPLIYHPLTSAAEGEPVTDNVARLIRAGAALFVMHTNYDSAPGGVNDALAAKLDVRDTSPMDCRAQDKLHKIVVFVPEEALGAVRDAMAEAGAGRIGEYSHCSFRVRGTGSFLPSAGARPYVGESGRLEEVEEYRLEMICVGSRVDAVVAAMIEKHPYEEVTYDIYELANKPVVYGVGLVGTLEPEMTFGAFAERVIKTLDVKYPKLAGDPNKPIGRVAMCGGGGSDLFRQAAAAGADAFVTGDTKHHDLVDANALGLAVIDAGHFETERPGMIALVDHIRASWQTLGVQVDYIE